MGRLVDENGFPNEGVQIDVFSRFSVGFHVDSGSRFKIKGYFEIVPPILRVRNMKRDS